MLRGSVRPLISVILAFYLLGTLNVKRVSADDRDEFEFAGVISSLPSTNGFIGDWIVGGRTVHVTSSTRIEQEEGSPAVGRRVEVEGILQMDGSVNATEIEVEDNDNNDTTGFDFRGRVETLPTTTGFIGDWTVGGRTIHVTSATVIRQDEAPLAVGAFVEITGTVRPDGTIDARRIETKRREQTSFFEFKGRVQTIPTTSDRTGDWTIGGRIVHVTSLTRIEGGPITVGTVVEVKGTVRTDGSVDAVKIEREDADDDDDDENEAEFHGVITSLPNTAGFIGDWTVGGRTIHVTSSTRIEQEEGLVAVGAFVEVEGRRREDGTIDATKVEVERSAGDERRVPTFELHGTVERLPSTPNLVGDWVVSGRTVHVTSTTILRPGASAISVGTFVEVEGNLRTDNTIDALSVEVERAEGNGNPTPFFAFFGTVETLPATTNHTGDWVVSGRTVHVAPGTQIVERHRPLVVGSFVKVVGVLRPDGSIDATQIHVKRSDNVGRRINFFELFGIVQSAPASGRIGDWTIGGLVVHTSSATRFAPNDRTPSVGSRVKVVGRLRNDGTLDADAIVVEGDVDRSEDFVVTHYDDFLGREPDESGRTFWTDDIEKCGSNAQCREVHRINVSAAFFLSIEFQQTGYLVERLYVASFGRRPTFTEFLADMKTISEGVVVGRDGWQRQLEANKQAFIADWVHHPAFAAVFGRLTNAQFVDLLIAHTGVALDASERNALIAGLNDGTLTRAAVVRRIVENRRFEESEKNRAFVLMQYFGYLRRDPDEAGFQFWLQKLNRFNGNFVQAEMVRAFIESTEYRRRFGK